MASHILVIACFLAIACALALASDPLQDFCVADYTSKVRVNGLPCLDSKLAQANHFFFGGLDKPGNTSNPFGFAITRVDVSVIPGLNTLGIAISRNDIEPFGVIIPHIHPRGTEVVMVIEGTVLAAFVTSNPENRLISKVLEKGDIFVVPTGLVHFQKNIGSTKALLINAFNSENPGFTTAASAVFGSNPPIADDILAKAFQVDKSIIDELQAQF